MNIIWRNLNYLTRHNEWCYGEGYVDVDVLGSSYTHHYFVKDHQGNIRVVADEYGYVVQRTDYDPFGMIMPGSTNQAFQPYKYNGKEFVHQDGLNLYDYGARRYDPARIEFTTMDPLAEKYQWISPYAYCNNDPVNFVDPTGMDYWSTKDPDKIRQFINAMGSRQQYFDFTGWNHATDAQFTSNLTFNDETGKAYTSYGTVIDGVATVVGVSFDANITPVSFSGEGYPGAFVYNYTKNMGGLYGWNYDAAQFMDISALVSNLAGFDPNSYGRWAVNSEGRITGLAPLQAKQPNMGRSVAKYIKGYGPVPKNFHHIKNDILNTVGRNNFSHIVGDNPNISVVNGKIVLVGAGGGFAGKPFNTGLNANDFLQ
ncbi:MAG: RHS repeat-associated core domain-containing protein [Tannerella sp.]|jgi:RHS repeat-associated protein|nr:RHS repeat-associated core domain-containing protein [Tannerella sp.]